MLTAAYEIYFEMWLLQKGFFFGNDFLTNIYGDNFLIIVIDCYVREDL